ncbi:hypothetical protein A2U01_0088045, partial [Trifolium medium]|nr:hypothetical protein [Trifolium medium]
KSGKTVCALPPARGVALAARRAIHVRAFDVGFCWLRAAQPRAV